MRPFNAFYYFARIAHSHGIRRNVLYHHASCSDDAAVADSDSWTNCNATSQPAVFANGYRRASLDGLTTFHIINRVVGRQELAVRTNLSVIANGGETVDETGIPGINSSMVSL